MQTINHMITAILMSGEGVSMEWMIIGELGIIIGLLCCIIHRGL